jgi:UDP-N-acetylglucosamine 2-epimerase (non-hydrolysing)/GDP/UDP-N,N'-diacetylbacillosamine 2-epimerase (hydrolysing)
LEVPAFKKATINIGDHQKGRLRATSIIDCAEKSEKITRSINQALSPEFQSSLKNLVSLYGQREVSVKIKNILKNIKLDNIMIKHFYDL